MKDWKFIRAAAPILALVALLGEPATAKEWTQITIGVEGAFPPYNSTTTDGKVIGYDIDVTNEVCKRANLKCQIVAQDWDSQVPGLLAGKFDAVLTMGPNPKRREVMDFTLPYARTSNTFGVLKSSPLAKLPKTGEAMSTNDRATWEPVFKDIQAILKGKTIGVPLSTSQQQFIEETFKDTVTVKTYKSSEQHTLDLIAGRIDAVFDNIFYLRDAVSRPGNEEVAIAGPLLTGGIMATDTCIGLRKGEEDLKAKLDPAIQSMIADGTMKSLSEKWFKFDVTPN
jgi:octopine/nopaline transport system substrate-binding protein